MKVSFLGYNRRETDDYFNYLNQNNAQLSEELETQKGMVEQLQKTIAEYENLDRLNKQEIESLQQQVQKAQSLQERLNDYEQQVQSLKEQAHGYEQDVARLKEEIEQLRQKAEKGDPFDNDKLGFIFAVAYRDMENKNKVVSAKIKEYANMMFERMRMYRSEVADIVNSVTQMQNQQRQALEQLCNDATERLEALSEASGQTIRDMAEIENGQNGILREIDSMITQTIKADVIEAQPLISKGDE